MRSSKKTWMIVADVWWHNSGRGCDCLCIRFGTRATFRLHSCPNRDMQPWRMCLGLVLPTWGGAAVGARRTGEIADNDGIRPTTSRI